MEHFRAIPGFEGIYEVSNLGTVRTVPRIDRAGKLRKVRVLKPSVTKDGYLRNNLSKDGRAYHISNHRLVYLAFVGPIPEGHEINHINGVRNDNRPENLECLSHAENVQYSKEVLKVNYASFGNAKITEDNVRQIRKLLAARMRQADIAAMFGVCKSVIGNINTGHSWSHVKD